MGVVKAEPGAGAAGPPPAAGLAADLDLNVRIPAWTPPRFFDAAAGLPPSPEAVRWMTLAEQSAWADPSGRHDPASRSRAVLERSRASFADLLACGPDEIWFAPNADVALITALHGICDAAPAGSPVLASPLERRTVIAALDAMTTRPVRYLPVDRTGRIDPSDAAGSAAALVVQAANREIGTRQPLDLLRDRGPVPLIVDATAVRSPNQLPSQWDALVLDPMMWGGPDGIAVLACRRGVPWRADPPAGPTRRFVGRVSPALAAGAAMSLPGPQLAAEEDRTAALVDLLAERLLERVPLTVRLGHRADRLGHVLAVSMLYVNSEQLVDELSRRGFAVHSGSACTSDTQRPSHVLTAIGALTQGNLRISLPPGCPVEQIAALVDAIGELVQTQRSEAGLE